MKKYLTILSFSIFILACKKDPSAYAVTGVFEATEIIVSAESTGKILEFKIQEGEQVLKHKTIGIIDSTQLHFNKLQLQANKVTVQSGKPDAQAQIEALEREIKKMEYEKQRVKNLLAGDVATQKQYDDVEAQLLILKAKLRSQKSNLNNAINTVNSKSNTVDIQIAQLNDQLKKCQIKSPIDGTVLVKYAEEGEMTMTGKALFKVANLDEMILKVYASSEQLSKLSIGQKIEVYSEIGSDDQISHEGTVSWISEKAEFTPKTVQTQEDRANLVYAVKIQVKNDGNLKIGMYGGVKLSEE